MVFYTTDLPPVAARVELRSHGSADSSPSSFFTSGQGQDSSQEFETGAVANSLQPALKVTVPEEFDWSDPRLSKEFIQFEMKFLANECSPEEAARYRAMRQSRNAIIFSATYIQDYAEEQRLKHLAEKLKEVERYLKPIRVR